MSILKYGCIATLDKYMFRQYQINLISFNTVKDVLFMNPKAVYKFATHREYPPYANDFIFNNGEYTVENVKGFIRFRTRIRNKSNKLFNSLEDCAKFCKMLYKDEAEYAKQEAFDYLVCYSGIPERYYKHCYELLEEHEYVKFEMIDGVPVYRCWREEDVDRYLENDQELIILDGR